MQMKQREYPKMQGEQTVVHAEQSESIDQIFLSLQVCFCRLCGNGSEFCP
eukprot:SAG31_NODE_8390_length_1460_cov_1.714181_1_plen_49_part_10